MHLIEDYKSIRIVELHIASCIYIYIVAYINKKRSSMTDVLPSSSKLAHEKPKPVVMMTDATTDEKGIDVSEAGDDRSQQWQVAQSKRKRKEVIKGVKRPGGSVRWAASSGRRGRAIGERIAQQALPGQSHCFFGNDLWWEPGGGGGGNGGDQR